MPRYRLTIAYDGTEFHGWQKQEPLAAHVPAHLKTDPVAVPDAPGFGDLQTAGALAVADAPGSGDVGERVALRTVQHVVEDAVRKTIREPITLVGASRTDAGVHAGGTAPGGEPGGQVCAFTTEPDEARGVGWPLARGLDALCRALNCTLPDDVKVLDADLAHKDFDPISMAASKGYTYTLHIARNRPLWERRHVYHLWQELDIAAMSQAGWRLIGEHDFASFAAAGHGRQSTVREIHDCTVTDLGAFEDGHRIRIAVSGNGFLYNMVRIIAGTLVDVGRGKLTPDDMPRIIEARNRTKAGPTLPAHGLRLEWIRYA